MVIRIGSLLLSALALAAFSANAQAQSNLTAKSSVPHPVPTAVVETDRIRDGLVGPVRRIRTEVVKLSSEAGKLAEGKRAVLEVVSYDLKGSKVENQYFPIAGANLTGKEVYKYDEKGNISEMTLLNTDGSLLSKEVYKYEFDFAGNWNKMTTSVAVIEGGKLSFEPTEVTYRAIMYYLDANMLRMSQPAAAPGAAPVSSDNKTVVPSQNSVGNNPVNPAKSAPSLPVATSADKLKS